MGTITPVVIKFKRSFSKFDRCYRIFSEGVIGAVLDYDVTFVLIMSMINYSYLKKKVVR